MDLTDPRMRRQERRYPSRRFRSPRVRRFGIVPGVQDGLRAPPIEDAAAKRQQVHDAGGQMRVVRGHVSPEIPVRATERLGAAGQYHVDALIEQRR